MSDLKEENVLLTLNETGSGYNLRLADMGMSYKLDNHFRDYPFGCTGKYFD